MIPKSIILLLLFIIPSMAMAQDGASQSELDKKYQSKVSSIDSIIYNLYAVISGEKGVERNWELERYLYYPGAQLTPSGKNKEGIVKARYLTPQDYEESSGKWLVENGFFEQEIHRVVDQFGPIAQVFSTYQCFNSMKDDTPFMRGINSIQLLNDGSRWWIINIFWTQESKDNPIPKKYLPE